MNVFRILQAFCTVGYDRRSALVAWNDVERGLMPRVQVHAVCGRKIRKSTAETLIKRNIPC